MIGQTNSINVKKATDYQEGSEGLVYTLASDGASYICSNYGTCTDAHVVVGEVHNGLPVTEVAELAFVGKSDIESIYFPDSILTVRSQVCKSCSNLKEVSFGAGVTSFAYGIIYNCGALQSIVLRGEGTNYVCLGNLLIDKRSHEIIAGGVASVTTPDTVARYFAGKSFRYCTGLKTINFPNNIERIDNTVFDGCSSLTSIVLSDSIHSLGAGSFNECTALTDVVVGKSVPALKNNVFNNCIALKTVTIKRYEPTSGTPITKLETLTALPYQNDGFVVKVPSAALEAYKTANNWNVFADKIVGYDE